MRFSYIIILIVTTLCSFCENCFAEKKSSTSSTNKNFNLTSKSTLFKQWFTGPIFTPSPVTISTKTPALGIGPIQYYYYGIFDEKWHLHTKNVTKYWSTQYVVYPQIGLTKSIGTEAFFTLANNYNKHKNYWGFLDITYRLGFQIMTDKLERGNWKPDLRLIIQEIFPTGKYKQLDPQYEGIDNLGQGSFQTGLYLAWQKGFCYNTKHAFNVAGAFGYFILSSVKIEGNTFYGGSELSRGRLYPGNLISIFSSGEFEASKHIALAYDSNLRIYLSGKYKSKSGIDNSVIAKQFVTLSFTPEIEITISEKAGFLMGPWFSITGQNSPAFVSFFVAFMCLF